MPENPFRPTSSKPEASRAERTASEKDARTSLVLALFSQRGTNIFNCAEAWLLSQGYKYEDMDGLWSRVPINWNSSKDWDYYFDDLIRDLRAKGFNDVADFVRKYVGDGYPEKGLRAYLADYGFPEEKFGPPEHYEDAPSPGTQSQAETVEEQKEKLDVMNLLTNRQAVIDALIEMEGRDWYERHQPSWGENSIDGALAEATSRKDYRGIIYGVGGWHRYVVDSNGNVRYIEDKGEVEAPKAKALGFKLV